MPFDGFKKRLSFSRSQGSYVDETKNLPPSNIVDNAPAPPPTYADVMDPLPEATLEEISAAFTHLKLSASPRDFPDASLCLAHLKLLGAFFALKEEIGYNDGIFDLWDSRVPETEDADVEVRKLRDENLSKVREKRWALYVARAVDRFEVWWTEVLVKREASGGHRLRESDFQTTHVTDFPYKGKAQIWTPDMLPPIDILLVWHSFMLNPRNYLEDCIRYGLVDLYATGMPWQAVDSCINAQLSYMAPEQAQVSFVSDTYRPWNLVDESPNKEMKCPRCSKICQVPWSTSGLAENHDSDWRPGLIGNGYGENEFLASCQDCGMKINHDVLRVAKFKRDTEMLLMRDWPMPGNVLGVNGIPPELPNGELYDFPGTFPNRMLKVELKTQILELCSPRTPSGTATMENVRDLIEKTITSVRAVRKINGRTSLRGQGGRLTRQERLSIRRMMSRYWGSHQIFSMELSGAIMRQGTFVDKMRGLDWLHSPTASETMQRLLVKYGRFMSLIALNPDKTAVPTLDVDLAWHTHQLSPASYFKYSLRLTRPQGERFIDHDDKIEEDKLSESFEWTSKVYEKTYGEIYSECACWYCESVRTRHISSVGSLLNSSRHEKISDQFHDSGAAAATIACDPEKRAHISAHNAMPSEHSELYARTYEHLKKVRQMQLDQAYEKACKRASKKGRKPPEKERFREEHFGYGYYGMYPYMGAYMWMTPGLYYYPMAMPMGAGMYGACAAGTCSGGVASGGCGGAGGCGGGCGGGAGGCGAGGAGGGCGGGGGGGGGCGGGGGGGCGGGS